MPVLFVSAIFVYFFFSLRQIGLDVRQTDVDFRVFEFVVLIEAAFWAIWLATSLNWTSVVSLNLICISSHPFDFIVHSLALAVKLFILIRVSIYLILPKTRHKLVFLLDDFLHLRGESDVSEQ